VFKGGYFGTAPKTTDKRIIDTNELMASRLETLSQILKKDHPQTSTDGFVQGLVAEDVTDLLNEGDEVSALIKNEAPNPDNILQQAKDKASELISDAKKQADTIVAEAMEQAANSKKNVLEEARMNGYREGINRATKEIDDTKRALAKQKLDLEAEYETRFESMESDLVATITGIYEHIFNVELSSNREILVYLINNTLRKV
jgi:flagellar assembly protein FliH